MLKAFQKWRAAFQKWRAARRHRKLVNSKRDWHAHVEFGGSLPLGFCSRDEAVKRAADHGTITYVDTQNAFIFIREKDA